MEYCKSKLSLKLRLGELDAVLQGNQLILPVPLVLQTTTDNLLSVGVYSTLTTLSLDVGTPHLELKTAKFRAIVPP